MTQISIFNQILPAHIDDIVAIDKFWFGQEPTETHIDWAHNFSWMYTVLTNNKKVEGYALVIPVNSFAHEALKKGEMAEDELTSKYIRSFEACSGLYLASIAAQPRAKLHIRRQLVGIAQGQILRPTREAFGIATSASGESLAREIGMIDLEYRGRFKGIGKYAPKLFVKNSFSCNCN